MTGNMIGRIFNNRYTITERIGIGGMAEVYRAQDNVLGRIVAVKIMLPQYAADASFTQRFKHEAASAANLQSPYIVNVYDWGQDEGTFYIVMEYVRGSDLKTAIRERGPINQRKVAEIGSQVCQALSAAHRLDIIHRDIKPQNIMVQPDGNVKVMDFGIARAKNSVMSQTSSVLGTAHYLSPEQAQGKELTSASDIYSLGVVLYEAATGTLPFDGPDAVSVAMKQVSEEPTPPSQINPNIDPDLEAIIMHALAKQPYERFATANDMRFALNEFIAGHPVKLRGGFANAETAVMNASGYPESGTAVMPAVSNTGSQEAAMYSADSTVGRRKKKPAAVVIGILVALAVIGIGAYALTGGFSKGDPVPNVVNMTVEAAEVELTDSGFKLGKVDEVFDDAIEIGKIISQDPAAGKKAEEGTKVNVVVSKGREAATIPDLTNMTASQAKEALESAGLKWEAGQAEFSDTIEKNHVVRQDPAGGAEGYYKGDTVTYYLSLGKDNTSVPSVLGMSQADAESALKDSGLEVSIGASEYSDDYAEGLVIRQSLPGGTSTPRGETVTIYISKGSDPDKALISIPDVRGWSLEEAKAHLENQGFNVVISSGSDMSAKVENQSPFSGTVSKGTTITLTPEVSTPDPGDTSNDDAAASAAP